MAKVSIWDRRTWGALREVKGITYATIAEVCQVYSATPEKWFRGERNPRINHQVAMAKILNIPLRTLLSGINDPAIKQAIRAAYNDWQRTRTMDTTPLYAKAAAIIGRPLVLCASLVMSSPAEISLARTAGFSGGTEYLAPFVLSLYAICAAVIAATRPKGVRGRLSAILGAGLALGFALSAQCIAHLISAGHVSSGPWLIAAVSAVPSVSAAHLLHLGVQPKADTVGVKNENPGHGTPEKPENDDKGAKATIPAAPRKKGAQGRSRPSLQAIRDVADTLDKTGQKVSAKALSQAFKVSERTGARYLSALNAA